VGSEHLDVSDNLVRKKGDWKNWILPADAAEVETPIYSFVFLLKSPPSSPSFSVTGKQKPNANYLADEEGSTSASEGELEGWTKSQGKKSSWKQSGSGKRRSTSNTESAGSDLEFAFDEELDATAGSKKGQKYYMSSDAESEDEYLATCFSLL